MVFRSPESIPPNYAEASPQEIIAQVNQQAAAARKRLEEGEESLSRLGIFQVVQEISRSYTALYPQPPQVSASLVLLTRQSRFPVLPPTVTVPETEILPVSNQDEALAGLNADELRALRSFYVHLARQGELMLTIGVHSTENVTLANESYTLFRDLHFFNWDAGLIVHGPWQPKRAAVNPRWGKWYPESTSGIYQFYSKRGITQLAPEDVREFSLMLTDDLTEQHQAGLDCGLHPVQAGPIEDYSCL